MLCQMFSVFFLPSAFGDLKQQGYGVITLDFSFKGTGTISTNCPNAVQALSFHHRQPESVNWNQTKQGEPVPQTITKQGTLKGGAVLPL